MEQSVKIVYLTLERPVFMWVALTFFLTLACVYISESAEVWNIL